MHIAVCIKQIPAKNTPLFIDTDKHWVNEDQTVFEINEADQYALEEALKLKDEIAAEVTVISLGAKRCSQALKECLAKGADQAIQINDENWAQLDPFQVASALANALKDKHCDLILTGLQSDDHGFSQIGIMIAELLGQVHVSLVVDINLQDRHLKLRKELEAGLYQNIECDLPAVLTIQSGINKPRYANMKGILQAKKKSQEHYNIKDQLSESVKATQKMINIYFPEKSKSAQYIDDTPDEAAKILLNRLKLVK